MGYRPKEIELLSEEEAIRIYQAKQRDIYRNKWYMMEAARLGAIMGMVPYDTKRTIPEDIFYLDHEKPTPEEAAKRAAEKAKKKAEFSAKIRAYAIKEGLLNQN